MTHLCRRCPHHGAPGDAANPGRASLFDEGDEHDFRVALVAGAPSPDATSVSIAAWHRAIAAFVTATMQRGGCLTVPADARLAHAVALAAAPWASSRRAEGDRPARVTLRQTIADRECERLFAPLMLRNLAELIDVDGQDVSPFRTPDDDRRTGVDANLGRALFDPPRHPFDRVLLDDALGLVIIGPDEQLLRDINFDPGTDLAAVIRTGPENAADGWTDHFVVTDHLDDQGPRVRRDDADDRDRFPGVEPLQPFGFLAERLLDDWLSR